jgi:cell division protein FtsQ
MLENQINNTPEVENVEIFIQPQGELSLLITERKPLFKVATQPLHFSDAHGVLFSYKEIDSTPYPVFNASSSTLSLKTTASLIQNLKEDPFMDRELISVSLKENQYELKLKSFDFQVIFGTPTSIENKIQKLKIFCTFQKVQDSLRGYQKINLSYDNQVVATTS